MVSDMIERVQRTTDRVVSPEMRSRLYGNVNDFFQQQPLIATFLLAILSISLPPLLLFTTFTLSILAFSLISAILFSLFWIGVAVLLLVPTLFVTCGLGIIIWAWGVSSWIVARWVYGLLPATQGSGQMKMEFPNGKKMVINKKEGEVPHAEVRNGL